MNHVICDRCHSKKIILGTITYHNTYYIKIMFLTLSQISKQNDVHCNLEVAKARNLNPSLHLLQNAPSSFKYFGVQDGHMCACST